MAITPADIQAQTFSEAKRGYDPAEVDVFLETLSSEVDAMLDGIDLSLPFGHRNRAIMEMLYGCGRCAGSACPGSGCHRPGRSCRPRGCSRP